MAVALGQKRGNHLDHDVVAVLRSSCFLASRSTLALPWKTKDMPFPAARLEVKLLASSPCPSAVLNASTRKAQTFHKKHHLQAPYESPPLAQRSAPPPSDTTPLTRRPNLHLTDIGQPASRIRTSSGLAAPRTRHRSLRPRRRAVAAADVEPDVHGRHLARRPLPRKRQHGARALRHARPAHTQRLRGVGGVAQRKGHLRRGAAPRARRQRLRGGAAARGRERAVEVAVERGAGRGHGGGRVARGEGSGCRVADGGGGVWRRRRQAGDADKSQRGGHGVRLGLGEAGRQQGGRGGGVCARGGRVAAEGAPAGGGGGRAAGVVGVDVAAGEEGRGRAGGVRAGSGTGARGAGGERGEESEEDVGR